MADGTLAYFAEICGTITVVIGLGKAIWGLRPARQRSPSGRLFKNAKNGILSVIELSTLNRVLHVSRFGTTAT